MFGLWIWSSLQHRCRLDAGWVDSSLSEGGCQLSLTEASVNRLRVSPKQFHRGEDDDICFYTSSFFQVSAVKTQHTHSSRRKHEKGYISHNMKNIGQMVGLHKIFKVYLIIFCL